MCSLWQILSLDLAIRLVLRGMGLEVSGFEARCVAWTAPPAELHYVRNKTYEDTNPRRQDTENKAIEEKHRKEKSTYTHLRIIDPQEYPS